MFQGHPRLVKAISILFKNILGRELDPYSEIFVSCGAYMGMYCAINGHCQEGDEVIIVDPSFNCYAPQVMAAGAKPVFVPLRYSKLIIRWVRHALQYRAEGLQLLPYIHN